MLGAHANDGIRPADMRDIELAIEGMTCAACAVRIEKKLTRLADVRASVSYATATARVTAHDSLRATCFIAVIASVTDGDLERSVKPPARNA